MRAGPAGNGAGAAPLCMIRRARLPGGDGAARAAKPVVVVSLGDRIMARVRPAGIAPLAHARAGR